MKAARQKKGLTTTDIGLKSTPAVKIFINEHLTENGRKLFYQAKQYKAKNNIKHLWKKNNRIYMRREDQGKVLQINHKTDFDKLDFAQ